MYSYEFWRKLWEINCDNQNCGWFKQLIPNSLTFLIYCYFTKLMIYSFNTFEWSFVIIIVQGFPSGDVPCLILQTTTTTTKHLKLQCVVPENIQTHPPPPQQKILGIPKGRGGGVKGGNFQGVGGFMGNYFSKRVTNQIQNIGSNVQSIWSTKTYLSSLHCFETKVGRNKRQ